MDTIDYLAKESYPLSTQSLDFIQNQILQIEKLGTLFGEGVWLVKETTDTDPGLAFVNKFGFCELIKFANNVTSTSHPFFKVLVENENGKISKKIIGYSTPEPDSWTTYDFRKIDFYFTHSSFYEKKYGSLIFRKDLRTNLVTVSGNFNRTGYVTTLFTLESALQPLNDVYIYALRYKDDKSTLMWITKGGNVNITVNPYNSDPETYDIATTSYYAKN